MEWSRERAVGLSVCHGWCQSRSLRTELLLGLSTLAAASQLLMIAGMVACDAVGGWTGGGGVAAAPCTWAAW